jgi:hypothetical protein
MMRNTVLITLLAISVGFIGCGHKRFHHGDMPDPGPYMVHFPELDADGDEQVTWEEFKARFPDTTEAVFEAVDLDGDGAIDHDEWHAFKEAHE